MPGETGSDLSKLEYEFATNPNSEAFIPLARAYLSMGRFVEAMVVCKKGIKAHPDLATGRLIMARIYADQAKHQKAIEELGNLLKLSPENGEAHRLMGHIHVKLGKQEDAIGFLKKAVDLDPSDREAKDALLKLGVDYIPITAAPPAPEAEPQPVVPEVQQRFTPAGGVARARLPAMPQPTPQRRTATPAAMPRATPAGGMQVSEIPTQRVMPAAQPAPVYPLPTPQRKRIADIYTEMEITKRGKERKGLKYTLILGGVLLVSLIIYMVYTWQAGLTQEFINKHLKDGQLMFNQDSYRGYTEALKHYREIYKRDNTHPQALSRGAFICAVLVGDFGGGKELITEGTKYINEANAQGQNDALLTAARGLMMLYGSGSKNDAAKLLEDAVKESPQSSVLQTALGYVLLAQGKLNEARDRLMEGAKSSDIRAYVGLGDWAIRRSMYREAVQAYNRALLADRGHARSLLMASLVAIIRGSTLNETQLADSGIKRFKEEMEKDASERDKLTAKLIETVIKARTADRRKGVEELKALAKKEAGNDLIQFVVARELRWQGEAKDAKEFIEKALRLDSTRPDFLLEEAAIYLALRDFEAARSRALKVQAIDPESGQSALLAGDAYRAERNFDKAVEYYKKAQKSEDTEAFSHLRLGQSYLEMPKSDRDLAQSELELAVPLLVQVDRRPAAEACFTLAKIYASKQLTERYTTMIEQSLTIDPTFAPPYGHLCLNLLGVALDSEEARAKAKETADRYLALDSNGEYANTCRDLLKRVGK